jgi:hypothetical protein
MACDGCAVGKFLYAGFRPSEVMRATPEDVLPYLDLPEPFCFRRVGKGSVPVMVPLPLEGATAWPLADCKGCMGLLSACKH